MGSKTSEKTEHLEAKKQAVMGCGQVVRQQVLALSVGGSNPSTPVKPLWWNGIHS